MKCTISIEVSKTSKESRILAGTLFAKQSVIDSGKADGTNAYILTIVNHKDDGPMASLVNMATGQAIHKLKAVKSIDSVTSEELAELNFSKSEPVIAITED